MFRSSIPLHMRSADGFETLLHVQRGEVRQAALERERGHEAGTAAAEHDDGLDGGRKHIASCCCCLNKLLSR